ncbi:unnamed protein product [Cuscuta campestris]|uniref:Retrotransposon gag domain-containing protein n=1 Tax=Cuscuta campestris TaxID=132261 RepID=A0A484KXA5_9ASTE|nr:unnamed protein product [Cuscuta campestris]
MMQTRSNANQPTGNPPQGETSATRGRHLPISVTEAEALIQRIKTTSDQFKEVVEALAPNQEIVMDDITGPQVQSCNWFHKLPRGSIDEWMDLAHKFLEHFASSRRQKLPYSHLLNVRIRKGKQLRDFITRWEKEASDVQGADDQAMISMLRAALPAGDVRKELRRNLLPTYQGMFARAKYLALEEVDDEVLAQRERKSVQLVGEEGRPRAEPAEDVEEVTLDPGKPEQKVKVSKTLQREQKGQLVSVLRSFKVLFAWGPKDMPGVDPRIICHRLAVDPAHKLVKQKKCFLSLERRDFMTKEIEFKPRPAIKGQSLADFVVECTTRDERASEEEERNGNWGNIYTDGSPETDALGGGVVAISPEGFKAYYSIRFRFKISVRIQFESDIFRFRV